MLLSGHPIERESVIRLVALLFRADHDQTGRKLLSALDQPSDILDLTAGDRSAILAVTQYATDGLRDLRAAFLGEHD